VGMAIRGLAGGPWMAVWQGRSCPGFDPGALALLHRFSGS